MDSTPASDYSGVLPVINITPEVQTQVDVYQAALKFIDEKAAELNKDMSPAFLNSSMQTETQFLTLVSEKLERAQMSITDRPDYWSTESLLDLIFDDLCTFRRIEKYIFERILDDVTAVSPPEVRCPNAREVLLWLSDDPTCKFCCNWDWASVDEELDFSPAQRELIRARLILAAKARIEQDQASKTDPIMPTQWELMLTCRQRNVSWTDRQCPLEGAPAVPKPRLTSVDEKTRRIAYSMSTAFTNQKEPIVAAVALAYVVEMYKSTLGLLAHSKKNSENVDDETDRMIEEIE